MYKVYDLSSGEGCFSPLPVTKNHRRSLRTAVLAAVREVPGGAKAVMATYSERPTEWDIPPLYSGYYKGVALHIAPEAVRVSNLNAFQEFDLLLKRFISEGWGKTLNSMLERRFGTMASHPASFDRANRNPGRFAVEYVVALSRFYHYGIQSSADTFAIRVPINDSFDLLGLVNGTVTGTDIRVSEADLYDWLLSARGTVTTVNYGVYDRILRWAEVNFDAVDDVDKLRLALSMLKLSQDPTEPFNEEEVTFEQKVRSAKVLRADAGKPAGPLTYDRFVEIRAIWLEAGEYSPEETFLELFSALVPDVYDSQKFKKLFGKLPVLEEKLTLKMLNRIDRGIELFTAEFTRMKEKV